LLEPLVYNLDHELALDTYKVHERCVLAEFCKVDGNEVIVGYSS